MPTTNTNIVLKGTNEAGGTTIQGPPRTGSEKDFAEAFDGASLAGIRGYSDKVDYTDGPRMAGIRGFSQPNVPPGGAAFANTSEMLRLRGMEDGEPTLQFRNSGMRAYQDMLGMPALAVG